MKRGDGTLPCCLVLLAGSFSLACSLSAGWENRLALAHGSGYAVPPGMRELSRAQAADGGSVQTGRTETGTAQKIWKNGATTTARYNFINFNRDRLGVSFGMTDPEFRDYMARYGYSDRETADLRAWREKARAAAWARGYASGGKPAAEKAMDAVAVEYDTRLRKLLYQRGFALRAGNVVECDMTLVVKRNIPVLKPLALAFQKISEDRAYGAEETVGAVLSMVQTALHYKLPPMLEGTFHTGGLLPPAKALLSGWGDCDTKTGVAASILGNWSGMRLVGVAVPGHYLMAIRRIPAKGDMFVRYEGLEYVLIEPAGPAWLEPGTVGRNTTALLDGSAGYTVEPFF